jgi:signal transduction histidine kinase
MTSSNFEADPSWQKKRFIVFVGILIATIPLVCLVFFIKFSFVRDLEHTSIQQRETFAVAATQILEERLENEIEFGNTFANRQTLQQAVVSGNQAEMEYHLKTLKELSHSFERVYIAAASGIMLATYPSDDSIIGKDFSHRDWYRKTTTNWQPYVSDFFLRAVQPERYIFTISLPIKSPGGGNAGILVLEPKDNFVATSLDAIKTGGSGSLYVVDKKGILIFHQLFAVDRSIDYSSVPAVAKVIKGSNGAEKSFNPLSGQEEVAAYHPVLQSGWGVVTVQPLKEILAPLKNVEKGLYLFIATILLLAGYNAFKWATMLLNSRQLAGILQERSDELAEANENLQKQSIALQIQAKELDMQAEEMQAQNEELLTKGEELEMQAEELFRQNEELADMQHKLALANEELEHRVKERTAALSAEIDLHRRAKREQLESEEEKKQLEHQLRQSQKMEVIGQLAGGVAHDFNNILTIIEGYGYIMREEMHPDDPQRFNIDQILAASAKAANLTHSLLAFSRKQVMHPLPVNLNAVVSNVVTFLRRILGEHINLTTITKADPLPILADSALLEQVLINFATNARDAMPKGGTLFIETDLQQLDEAFVKIHGFATPPGLYSVIHITDTGCGMDEQTVSQVFEPFFTTKGVGKGTGLGMSIAYGIIKQHNGYINVYSEPENGTTFRVYLPAMVEKIKQEQIVTTKLSAPSGGTETILLVEDDLAVRDLMEKILLDYGYQLILAEDGRDAVVKFTENMDKIKLVLMDVIMPKKNGKEAADEIRRLMPGIQVLFSSGYTADFIRNQTDLPETAELIMKPVKPLELISKVEELLGRY